MRKKGFIIFVVVVVSAAGYFFIGQETLTSVPVSSTSTSVKILEKLQITLSACLPENIKLDDVVSADISGYENGEPVGLKKVTVEQKLAELNVTCENGKLLDSFDKEIYFYHLTGCWGNPPYNYQEILDKQRDEINNLKKQYTIIEMTCNPSGKLIY